MDCRAGCGACCIAPSITRPIPGMPDGKPAGVRCVQLTAAHACALYGRPERPAFCAGLAPSAEMCGASRTEALVWLARLEEATRPQAQAAGAPSAAAARSADGGA
ncbi:MAG: YkgJ family cysteine cluster protein [Burkholderiales bacterium]|nr:YkgJ family cysteine cluster protein [Burkholderiales bacterium]